MRLVEREKPTAILFSLTLAPLQALLYCSATALTYFHYRLVTALRCFIAALWLLRIGLQRDAGLLCDRIPLCLCLSVARILFSVTVQCCGCVISVIRNN